MWRIAVAKRRSWPPSVNRTPFFYLHLDFSHLFYGGRKKKLSKKSFKCESWDTNIRRNCLMSMDFAWTRELNRTKQHIFTHFEQLLYEEH